MNLERLKEPFPASDIEWRVQRDGVKDGKAWCMVLAYVTARAIQDRLDEVCGIGNWKDEYIHLENGVMCGLSIRIPIIKNDIHCPEWVTKWDGSPETKVESFKGGISKALVRCGSKWGIGRYLYNLSATFGTVSKDGTHFVAKHKDKFGNEIPAYKWDAPNLPAWALPSGKIAKDETPEVKQSVEEFENGMLSVMPEQVKNYCKLQKFTVKETKEYCREYEWHWDEIRLAIDQQEDAPA